ncbi:ABC transporter permease [Rhizobium helianthi]|uniref:ABC transporter permease n=1 Tax=Rhizobium helianthi TaxID=1132695 RepID=A0ABW4LZ96_9HYPH
MGSRLDKLGFLIAILNLLGMAYLPLVVLKPNRIVQGQALPLWEAVATPVAGLTIAAVLVASLVVMVKLRLSVRLAFALLAVVVLMFAAGLSATHLVAPGNGFARISLASGFWVLLFANTLTILDALAKIQLPPLWRLVLLAAFLAVCGLFFVSGGWSQLSILKEYASRSDVFWREVSRHVLLAAGSLMAALLIGLPLGLVCHRVPQLQRLCLALLNTVQTIPSMALFGLLIAPMGWLAVHMPGASDLGIRGIGAAPAFVALVLYSLLPVVANTVSGLDNVSAVTVDAARGLGMSRQQLLWRIEVPLAMPAILTAIRIVLVQNIGMATIAALIGGGGLGVFVFQGIGQTAMDLVLLGALPTVVLALCAAVAMDALVDGARGPGRKAAR